MIDGQIVTCNCCGGGLQSDLDRTTCSFCETVFDEDEIILCQINEREGQVVVTDAVRASRMLCRPGDANWVIEQFRAETLCDAKTGLPCIPLEAIRRFATTNHINIAPLKKGQAWWILR